MLHVVRAKFDQNPHLRDQLLNTNDAILVENAGAMDSFYGAGADGTGCNYLGIILMRVRHEIKQK
jgi:hypothetical protein